MRLFSYIFLILAINKLFANNVNIKPSIFTIHSSNGKDWMYQEKAINIFDLDQVWLMITNQNPLKKGYEYLDYNTRIRLDSNKYEWSI